MNFKFSWPVMPNPCLRENIYLGGWHPDKRIEVDWEPAPLGMEPVFLNSNNWFLMSNSSDVHSHKLNPHKPGLIHALEDSTGEYKNALGFRGYILGADIHSYSESSDILQYWFSNCTDRHNGVFSAALIKDQGNCLELVCDAFGMAPLYYRNLNGGVIFSTNPRYLTAENDMPDYIAWRGLIQSGYMSGNRSLSSQIKMVPPGSVLQWHHQEKKQRTWFDFANLPPGDEPITPESVTLVEDSFQQAMDRCLNLQGKEDLFLPFSSGYDSRRIFASLVERKKEFSSTTVQIFQKGFRDLDVPFASAMARDFNIPHKVIKDTDPETFAKNDAQKRLLVDGETFQHSWAVPLMASMPRTPTLLFDGIAGDVLGQSMLQGIDGLFDNWQQNSSIMVNSFIRQDFDNVLAQSKWPCADHIRNDFLEFINDLPIKGNTQIVVAYLMIRIRRSTSPWVQQMLSTGHIVVCPYLDLDHVKTLLRYSPSQKREAPFQKKCLEQFWPQYFSYAGTRSVPPDMPKGSTSMQNEKFLACIAQMYKTIKQGKKLSRLFSLLSLKEKLMFIGGQKINQLALKRYWAVAGLMALVAREAQSKTCWRCKDHQEE